jgi:hypothetical protein
MQDLLDEFNFKDKKFNPRNVKSDMLSPKPNDRFTNDVKQLKNLVQNIPTIYGTDSVRILTQGKVDTKKLKQKSLKVAGNLIEKGFGVFGNAGKSVGNLVNNKLNETIKPQLPSDLIEGTSTTKGLYTDMLTGGVDNSKTAVGNFLSSFATPDQFTRNIGPAATSVISDFASKKIGGVASQLGIAKDGAQEPTLLGGIVGGIERQQTIYPSIYVDGLVNSTTIKYNFDKSNTYTNPQNGLNFNQSQFARKQNIGQIYDGDLSGVTSNNPGVPRHLRGNLVENINAESIIYKAVGKPIYNTNLIYTFTKKKDFLVDTKDIASANDLDNLAKNRADTTNVSNLGFNSPKAGNITQGINTYRTQTDTDGLLNVTSSPIGSGNNGDYKIVDIISTNKPKRFSETAYDSQGNANTKRFGGYNNRIGNDLAGKINKEHRDLSKKALNDTGYDLIHISFKYGKSEIRLMATLTGLTDTPTANWNDVKAIGSPYKFYFYDSFEREISFKCQLYATNEEELKTLWEKVNSLLKLSKPAGFGSARGTVGKLISLKIGSIINITSGFLTNCTMTVPDNSPWEIKTNSQAPFMCELDFSYKAVTLGGELYTGIATPGYQYSRLDKEGKLPIPSNTSNQINIPPNGEPDIIKLPNTNLTEPQTSGGMLGVSNPFSVTNDSATSNPFNVPNDSATSNPFSVPNDSATSNTFNIPKSESNPTTGTVTKTSFSGYYNPSTGEESEPGAKALFDKVQKIKEAARLKQFGK